MSVGSFTPQDYESLAETGEALSGMMSRLQAIISGSSLSQDTFVEIASIYNNVAYIFLYLESNAAHVDYSRLLPWRDAFYADPGLDARILELLTGLRCPDPDAEESRLAFVKHLSGKTGRSGATPDVDLDDLVSAA